MWSTNQIFLLSLDQIFTYNLRVREFFSDSINNIAAIQIIYLGISEDPYGCHTLIIERI